MLYFIYSADEMQNLQDCKKVLYKMTYLLVQVTLFVYRRLTGFIVGDYFFIKLHFNISGWSKAEPAAVNNNKHGSSCVLRSWTRCKSVIRKVSGPVHCYVVQNVKLLKHRGVPCIAACNVREDCQSDRH